MTERTLVKVEAPDVMTLGKVLASSGYFSDAKQAGQAVVKVLAGQELGFGPIASMTGIYIVKGRVTLSANLLAAAIKRSGRYSYRVLALTESECSIEFTHKGEILGTSTFTMEDAQRAGLSGQNWKAYPRNMLFARAISNGAKWYCPDVFGGPIYTPDELGAEVDGETGEIIDVQPEPAEAEPEQEQEQEQEAVSELDEHFGPKEKPKSNGKGAVIKTAGWAKAALAVARDWPHYQNADGSPNFPHMLNAAANLGYSEITDKNLVTVCQALRDHAKAKFEEESAS